MAKVEEGPLNSADYAALAAFRFEIRRFLAFSEQAAAARGLPAQQHQALLAIAGHLGPEAPTVGLVAEQLLIGPSSAVELVSRMVAGGLLTKEQGASDRRRSELRLTNLAGVILNQLSEAHLKELQVLEPALMGALQRLTQRPSAEPH